MPLPLPRKIQNAIFVSLYIYIQIYYTLSTSQNIIRRNRKEYKGLSYISLNFTEGFYMLSIIFLCRVQVKKIYFHIILQKK